MSNLQTIQEVIDGAESTLASVTPAEASNALLTVELFSHGAGKNVGDFQFALLRAFEVADRENTRTLTAAYPGLGSAYIVWRYAGLTQVVRLRRRYDEAVAALIRDADRDDSRRAASRRSRYTLD